MSILSVSCAKKTTQPTDNDTYLEDFAAFRENYANCINEITIYNTEDHIPGVVAYFSQTIPFQACTIKIQGEAKYIEFSYELDKVEYTFPNHTPFVAGRKYSVSHTIDGVETSADVEMAYPPIVTTSSTTFNHTQSMTFNWTLGKNAIVQLFGFEWETTNHRNGNIVLSPSNRQYIIPANTVDADWLSLSIELDEWNYYFSGVTAFGSAAEYRHYFYRE